MELVDKITKAYRSSVDTSSNKYLMVPIFIFFSLLILAMIRSPIIISQSGIGSAIILSAPLILTTYALTFIVMAGRGGVDLSIGPFMGFINVSSIQLYAHGYLETSDVWFIYAIAMGCKSNPPVNCQRAEIDHTVVRIRRCSKVTAHRHRATVRDARGVATR